MHLKVHTSFLRAVMADGHFFANKIVSEIIELSHEFSQKGLGIFGELAYV